ncbi:flippase [Bacteroidales bacterium SW292]|nr:flippase [Bacteroidales bacterium SW292]
MSNKISVVFRRIKYSKEGKTLIENFISLSALQIIGYIFPLITLPYISRVVGVEHFGEIAFATSVVMYFQTFVDWGYNFTATRDIARIRNDKDTVSTIYSTVFWSRLFLCIISLSILTLLVLTVPLFQKVSLLLYFRFLVIFGYLFYADWLFQAIEKMKFITLLNITANLIFTVSVFIFIREREDYILQPLLTSLGFLIAGLIAFVWITPREGIRLKRIKIQDVFLSLRKSTDVFVNQAMPILYENLSVMLLGFWGGSTANGIFDAGNKLISVVLRFVQTLSRTFFPFLARRIDKHDFFAKLNLIVSISIAILLFFAAPFIINIFFSSEFVNAIIVLRIISLSIPFSTLINVYGVNYLIQQGEEKILRRITVSVSIIGIVLAFPLIYTYSWVGAALTLFLTRSILGISITVKAIKIKHQN